MKRKLLFAVMLAATLSAEAKNITGRVTSDGKGIAGVVVTDGTGFATTTADGTYTIDAADNADFVYIVTPSGYVATYASGTPAFYKPLNSKNFDFELFRFGVPKGTYTLLGIGDTQPGSDHDYERLENEALPDIRRTAASYQDRNIPVAALVLGDLVWDNLETYSRFKSDMQTLGCPVYTLIGNHDHDQYVSDDHGSAEVYRRYFGPTYYAFNIGNDYFIVLDNIVYKGNKNYDEAIDDQQLKWVEDYRKFIPKGSRVFVAMHCPAYIYRDKKKLTGADRLMDLLADYKVSILSGHTHEQSNLQLRPNVIEHMVGAVCGAWWIWNSPYCKDGTPMGYQVFESTLSQLSWYYKSLGRDRNYQVEVIPTGTFPGHENDLCVKVWNYDDSWRIELIEDGKNRGAMKQFASTDPYYSSYLDRGYATGKKKVGGFRQPTVNGYAFFCARPSAKAKHVAVRVTDRFGRVYTADVK